MTGTKESNDRAYGLGQESARRADEVVEWLIGLRALAAPWNFEARTTAIQKIGRELAEQEGSG